MTTMPIKLILLPGLDGTCRFFKPLTEVLDRRFEAVPVSYPMDQPLQYGDLLDLVTARIPDRDPHIILGESFGGPLAVMAAASASDNLTGVILAVSFVTSPLSWRMNILRPLVVGPMMSLRPPKKILERLLCAGCSPATARFIQRNLPELPPPVFAARVRAVMAVDARPELTGIPVPIHYIQAARDRVVPPRSLETIRAVRPDVTVSEIDGPHMILQCAPDACARAILQFAERIGDGGA